MRKAIINTNFKVENIIEYTSDVGISGLIFPLGYLLWDITDLPVIIGDDFNDGVFTRNGNQIERILAPEELQADTDAMVIDHEYRLLAIELEV